MSDTDTKTTKGTSTRAAAKQAAATAATASSVTPGSTDNGVSDEGTSPRSSGRRRSLSFLAHEALTNKWSEEEFETALARSMQVFKGGRAAAPSTAPVAANSHTASLSSSQSSSSAPPRAVGSRTNNDDPLHGLNAALARATNRESQSSGDNDIAAEPPSSRRGHVHANPIPPRMVAETAAKGGICNSDSKDRHTHRHRRERHRRSHSRSRSRSSSSSPDQYTRDKHSLYYKGQRIHARNQWHLSSAARVLANYWSFSDWYGNNKLKVKRNAFEAEELCAIIDEIRWGSEWAEQGDMYEAAHHFALALEIASRRLEGVVRADESGHWEHANALSLLKRTELGNAQLIRSLNSDISRARSAGNTKPSQSSSSSPYLPQQQPAVWRGGNRRSRGHGRGGRGGRGGNTNNGNGGNGKATDNKSPSSDNTATK